MLYSLLVSLRRWKVFRGLDLRSALMLDWLISFAQGVSLTPSEQRIFMGLLIVNEDEWNNSLRDIGISSPTDTPSDQSPQIEYHIIEKGRGHNSEIPEGIREIIAEDSLAGARSSEIQELYGVSASSISAYKAGANSTSTYREKKDNLLKVRSKVSSKANKRLIAALDALADKDFTELKAKDVSSIAKDMASIVDKIRLPSEKTEDDLRVHLHLYAPKMKSLADYEVIDVGVQSTPPYNNDK